MNNGPLDGMRVAILCTNDFEQVEMTEPRKALEDAGAQTVLVCPEGGEVQGYHHDKPGDKFRVDMTLADANPENFDAVLLPGGALNADRLRVNQKAQRFVQEIEREGKPIAVICHGPWLLINAGLVGGRTMTGYHTIAQDLKNAGANYVDQQTVLDRNWVSSRQPSDIPAFDQQMVQLFAQHVPQHH